MLQEEQDATVLASTILDDITGMLAESICGLYDSKYSELEGCMCRVNPYTREFEVLRMLANNTWINQLGDIYQRDRVTHNFICISNRDYLADGIMYTSCSCHELGQFCLPTLQLIARAFPRLEINVQKLNTAIYDELYSEIAHASYDAGGDWYNVRDDFLSELSNRIGLERYQELFPLTYLGDNGYAA